MSCKLGLVGILGLAVLGMTPTPSSSQSEPNTYEVVLAKIQANSEYQKYHGNVKSISGIAAVSAGAEIKEKVQLNVPLPVELKVYSFANCNPTPESWHESLTRLVEQTATVKWDRTTTSTTEQSVHIEAGVSAQWIDFKTTADFLNRQVVTLTNSQTVTTHESTTLTVPIDQEVPSMTKKFLRWAIGKRQDTFSVSGTVVLDAALVVGVYPWGTNFKEHIIDKPLSVWYPNPRDRETDVRAMVWTVTANTTDVTWASQPLTPQSPECITAARLKSRPARDPVVAFAGKVGLFDDGVIKQLEPVEATAGLRFSESSLDAK